MLLPLAAALLLTPPGSPAGGFHWQRIITPPPRAGTREACVVLDAATFANAAPALRDLRLFQDGNELAYVIEESYDERALNSGVTPQDDRSEYEPVLIGFMHPLEGGIVAGGFSPSAPSHGVEGNFHLDARVPVERLRLEPAPTEPTEVYVAAGVNPASPSVLHTERLRTVLTREHPVWPLTLGVNLQKAVTVTVTEYKPQTLSQRVILEMRKRSLCYQPRSANPLVLYLGGGEGISAKTYSPADGFSAALERPYATMGPLEPNPDQQSVQRHHLRRRLLAIAVLATALLLTAVLAATVLRKEKARQPALYS